MKALSLLTLFLLALPSVANATLVVQYDLDRLVAESHGIVHARVVSQRAEWREGTIVTYVDVEVVACLKGPYEVSEIVTVEQVGGRIGDMATRVAGAPVFLTGEEVVLFLEPGLDVLRPLVVGMAQGKFSVLRDASGQAVVTRDLQGLSLVDPSQLEAPAETREPVVLDEILTTAPADLAGVIELDAFMTAIRARVEVQTQ